MGGPEFSTSCSAKHLKVYMCQTLEWYCFYW